MPCLLEGAGPAADGAWRCGLAPAQPRAPQRGPEPAGDDTSSTPPLASSCVGRACSQTRMRNEKIQPWPSLKGAGGSVSPPPRCPAFHTRPLEPSFTGKKDQRAPTAPIWLMALYVVYNYTQASLHPCFVYIKKRWVRTSTVCTRSTWSSWAQLHHGAEWRPLLWLGWERGF